MDDRQQQIRERAGLEESRLNQEFIDWLRKWGTPILFVSALAAAGFALNQRWEKAKAEKVDNAFIELGNANQGENPSPDALTAVATEYDGVRSVGLLARLDAADAYLSAVQRGLKLGATLKPAASGRPDGTLENADDALKPELKTSYLDQAGRLYQAVYEKSMGQPAKMLLSLNALYGLAAVAEGQGNFDAAKGWYEKIEQLTDHTPYSMHVEIAKARIAKLGDLAKLAPVLTLAELPKRPEPPAPPAPKPVLTPVPAPGSAAPGATPTTTPGTPPKGLPGGTTPGAPAAPTATTPTATTPPASTSPAATPPSTTPPAATPPASTPEPTTAPATPK